MQKVVVDIMLGVGVRSRILISIADYLLQLTLYVNYEPLQSLISCSQSCSMLLFEIYE